MMFSPLQLKAAAVGILVAIATIAALTAWAFYERSRYFECKATTASLAAEIQILGDKLDTQSGAIDGFAAVALEAVASSGAAVDQARAQAGRHARLLEQLDQLISQAPPRRPDGTAKDCADARREIRSLKGAP